MHSMNVEKITVTVTLSTGDEHTLVVRRPFPNGGNPRYIAQQIDNGLKELSERAGRVADLYDVQLAARSLT